MARKEKHIIKEGLDIREVGYYSTPSFIADFITNKMLEINPNGKKVLDPAVGKEELLKTFYERGMQIDSFDIIDFPKKGYSTFRKSDFLDFYIHFISSLDYAMNKNRFLDYDYYICNPPYNCHEVAYIKNNKQKLKSAFGIGVHNMYSMFLSAIITLAKPGSLIGVIISDSFLTSAIHSKLRKQILSECSIHSLILCPNNLFWSENADVRTCILILQKGKEHQREVELLNRLDSIERFKYHLSQNIFSTHKLHDIVLNISNRNSQFVIGVDPKILQLFYTNKLLGDVFTCVTCISTGNDAKYLSTQKKEGYSVPFYKNPASKKFVGAADAYLVDNFMQESQLVKDFMVRNKSFIGKEGIACSSMGLPFSAVLLPYGAVTGVNATIFPPEKDRLWLLSYLNSSLVTYLIRGILIRSNMVTSGYVNSLPIISFSMFEKKALGDIAFKVINDQITSREAVTECDKIIFSNINLPEKTISSICYFANHLNKMV